MQKVSLESRVTVVEVGKVGNHPNADTLDITHVNGNYPCIIKRGGLKQGDKAVYIPVDSVVPIETNPNFAFLKSPRIKAIRLRGIFSMGLLIPLNELNLDAPVGADVSEQLGITKYEPPVDKTFWKIGDMAPDPGIAPVFDVEGLRMFPTAFEGKEVQITEKIHGTNFRAVYHDGQLHVGTHRTWLKKGPNTWWNVAQNVGLEEKLKTFPDVVLYGEIYGPKIQDLTYGVKTPHVVFYDVLDTVGTGNFLRPGEAENLILDLDLDYVPVLFCGMWRENLLDLAEGQTHMGGDHTREGIVIRPQVEEFSEELGGRLILKQCGEGYYLRKEK